MIANDTVIYTHEDIVYQQTALRLYTKVAQRRSFVDNGVMVYIILRGGPFHFFFGGGGAMVFSMRQTFFLRNHTTNFFLHNQRQFFS